jgi:hypothetical protein
MSTPLAENFDDPSVMLSQYWQVVFDDDTMLIDNKAPNEDSGWHRLRKYLKENPKKIKSFTLNFMGKGVTIQGEELEDADGIYFFSTGTFLMGSSAVDIIAKSIGVVKNGTANITTICRDGMRDGSRTLIENDPGFIEI